MLTSDFRPEVEIQPFGAFSMHPVIIILEQFTFLLNELLLRGIAYQLKSLILVHSTDLNVR